MPGSLAKRDAIIARLILNTRRKKRLDSIVQVAQLIDEAKQKLGGLDAVAAAADVGVEMLRRFLFVRRLCPEVQALVAARKIDNLNVVIHLRAHKPNDQLMLARAFVDGNLSAEEMRALAPARRSRSGAATSTLLDRLRRTKDRHVYVARFRFPLGRAGQRILRRPLVGLIGKKNVLSLDVTGDVATLETTRTGRDTLRSAAGQAGLTLRKFMEALAKADSRG